MDDNEVNNSSPGDFDELDDFKGESHKADNGSENLVDLGLDEPHKEVEQNEHEEVEQNEHKEVEQNEQPEDTSSSEKMSGDGPSSILQHVDPRALELVYWRRPIKSGLVLLALFALQIGLVFCSVISVIAYTGLVLLIASASLRVYSHFLKKTDHPFKDYLETETIISREQTEELTRKILGKINNGILTARDVFLISNYVESLKFAAILYVLTYIGARFNFLTLCILCTVSVFTLPKIYETYQTQIDQLLAVVKAKLNDLLTLIRGKMETLPVVGKKMKSN